MIDVGQGDAIALRTPQGHWILFDAGRDWTGGDAGRSTVIPYSRRRAATSLLFVLSHPHADHVGGGASVLAALHPARTGTARTPARARRIAPRSPRRATHIPGSACIRATRSWSTACGSPPRPRLGVDRRAQGSERAEASSCAPRMALCACCSWATPRGPEEERLVEGPARSSRGRAQGRAPWKQHEQHRRPFSRSCGRGSRSFRSARATSTAIRAPSVMRALTAAGAPVLRTDLEGSIVVPHRRTRPSSRGGRDRVGVAPSAGREAR